MPDYGQQGNSTNWPPRTNTNTNFTDIRDKGIQRAEEIFSTNAGTTYPGVYFSELKQKWQKLIFRVNKWPLFFSFSTKKLNLLK